MNVMSQRFKFLRPSWPDMPSVVAFTAASTTEASRVNFRGSSDIAVESRRTLEGITGVPIRWLEQPHGNSVIRLPEALEMNADGAVTSRLNTVCAMRSADCLPILFRSKMGDVVGVAHAGWKGFRAGIIQNTLRELGVPSREVYAWLGPAISAPFYEVGEEVYEQFREQAVLTSNVFSPTAPGKFQMDLYAFARNILRYEGLSESQISGGDLCCFSDRRLHCVRRDGESSGRMATVIWIKGSGVELS